MTFKTLLHKLNNGKGIEWYHLVLACAIVGYFAYSHGVTTGAASGLANGIAFATRCDSFDVTMRSGMMDPGSIIVHPCDVITFTNSADTDMSLMDASNTTLSKIIVGKKYNITFSEIGTFMYHSDKYPETMLLRVDVK